MTSIFTADVAPLEIESDEVFGVTFNRILNSSRGDSVYIKLRGFLDDDAASEFRHNIGADLPERDYYAAEKDKFDKLVEHCVSSYLSYNSGSITEESSTLDYLESPLATELYHMFLCRIYKLMYNRLLEQGLDEYLVLRAVGNWLVLASRMKDSSYTEPLLDSILELFCSLDNGSLTKEEAAVFFKN